MNIFSIIAKTLRCNLLKKLNHNYRTIGFSVIEFFSVLT